ncbi:carboxylesterase/lipase family protein [Nocardia fluminea]|uniref:carboxylesterase/lipase family protein n=1 Tax=Nocardia fluminea TaxID=134984 RepID=UPI003411D81F
MIEATDPVVVSSRDGAVRGIRAGTGAVFCGIPFAAPPLGERRFRPPQPPRPWTGVRDCTVFPPAPPQTRAMPASATPTLSSRGAVMMDAARRMGDTSAEDCLYLNIWTPSTHTRSPVLVWIYGGGFETGSASPPKFDGAAVSRLTGAVVVAANYRLGALGWVYPTGPDRAEWADSANLGLQDQAAALRWVNENIADFGGDPDNVTVGGSSAGAFSVGALLTQPAAAGTFHRAILHSGSTGRAYPPEIAESITAELFSVLGVTDMRGLAAAPLEDILRAQITVIDSDIGVRSLPGGRAWGVVHDGTVVVEHPHDAVRAGTAAGIPLLIGANKDEFRMFAALGGDSYCPPDESWLRAEMTKAGVERTRDLLAAYRIRARTLPGHAPAPDALEELRTLFLSDAVYRVPAIRLARAQTAAGGRAYTYLFNGSPFGEPGGAYHSVEALYLYDKLAALDIDTPEHRAVRDALAGAWARFLATGDPGWPAYDFAQRANTYQIGGTTAFAAEPPEDVAAYWLPDACDA